MSNDSDFVNIRWFDYERRVREASTYTARTKDQIIKEGIELANLRIEMNLLDIPKFEVSAFLFKELNKLAGAPLEQPEFTRRHIQRTSPPEFKQEKEISDIESHVEWNKIETEDASIDLEKSSDYGIKINGVEYTPKSGPRQQENTQDKDKIIDKNTTQSKWLHEISKNANKLSLTAKKLWEEYNKDGKVQEIIDTHVDDIDDKLGEQVNNYAVLTQSKDVIDDRRSFGEWEKIMGAFMIETGETIARIAQLMDYSEKYGSIGLLREPKVREFFENSDNYPLYLRTCPSCYEDISQSMNRNIALYRECKSLKINIPVIKYS